jgi:hypothetical protein
MLPCRQRQTTRHEGTGRQEEAGKGIKQRLARASKQVGRGMKQRSMEAGKGRLGHWQASKCGRKHKILVEYWLMLVIYKHDTGFDCASCSIDW